MLQLSRLDITTIGAISTDPFPIEWTATERLLTYNMNELATVVSKYPTNDFPIAPSTTAYLHSPRRRNLDSDREDAKKRLFARHRFK
ncbi:uncharacterized protein BDZ99DRAFT_466274 [Mytilinidion resinicola]|uniref:Uncharacterized protein n=1 Tax=Mytilinidion resinicola TaxID=574789 RepID=A0A6A6YBA2_9PEZI|nr:uncharacterized protein BDZ99DRAFT_466274 [Mytilinidion resinicola]KAF2805980.1 hypothetical protein BDZ99DRAFT_466274 [Mytilinidion resinicola]